MKMKVKPGPRNKSVWKTPNSASVLRRVAHSECGQSLVELALLTPILLLLVIGTVEMGRYAYLAIMVANAARAGADYGAQNPTTAGVGSQPAMVAAALADISDIASLSPTATATDVCGCDTAGAIVPDPETNAACSVTCNVS